MQKKYCLFSNDHILLHVNTSGAYDLPDTLDFILDHDIVFETKFHMLCVTAEIPSTIANQHKNFHWVKRKVAFELLESCWFSATVKAYHLLRWDKQHQFCGQCGSKTTRKNHTFERECVNCALFFYPRISPSIIVMIQHEDKILMARSPHFAPGVYGLIAGFVEPGESLEEAVHREVKEEVGLSIKNLRYFGSQPWPFPDSLMMAFIADYAEGEITFLDGEIEAASWHNKDNLPGRPSSSISIANQLIDYFLTSSTINL